jgi:hypothetical protein
MSWWGLGGGLVKSRRGLSDGPVNSRQVLATSRTGPDGGPKSNSVLALVRRFENEKIKFRKMIYET